jgi:sugar phosphate isomerase/epimerase
MDNIARGGPDTVPAMLRELGYDGYGGRVPDEIMAPAITAKGLKFFNGYHVIDLNPATPAPNEKLLAWLKAMGRYDTVLWLGINKVTRADGTAYAVSSTDADDFVLSQIRAIADAAKAHHVRVALYPHTGFWMARVDDAQRLADKINRPDVGVTFNLCHWLKVEGSERDPVPVLRAALPRLMFVSISGADTGDTRTFGWDRLIQPLDAGTYDLAGFPVYTNLADGFPATTNPDRKLLIGYAADSDRYENWFSNSQPLQDSQQPFVGTAPLNTYPADPTKRDVTGGFFIAGQVPGSSAVHTASDIPLSAYGRGAAAFTGAYDNTDVFFKMASGLLVGTSTTVSER